MIYRPQDNAELAAIVTAAGDTVLLRGGVTYSASAIPASLLTPDNITLGTDGSGDMAVVSAGEQQSSWTLDAGNAVYASPAYASNFLGNVAEDGVPMKFVAWSTDLATTAVAMTSGQSLPAWSGSMTFNPATRVVYIKPSSGAPSEHEYIVSTAGGTNNCGIFSSASASGLSIRDLAVEHVSRHGVLLYNKKALRLENLRLRFIGGARPSSLYMGNGVELGVGVQGAQVLACQAADIFDSAYTTQLHEGTPAQIGGHYYEANTANRFGMHGIEISVQTAAQRINDVEINGLQADDAGSFSWAGDRNGAAVTFLSNSLNSGRVTRGFARGVYASRMKRLYLGYQHGGVCGIDDSVATGTWGQAPTSAPNGATGQSDLWRGVVDSAGAPSGAWTQAGAVLKYALRGFHV